MSGYLVYRRLATLGSVCAAIAMLGGGCGGSSHSPTTNGGSTQSAGQAPFRYADCMRSHGVPNFPDPKVSGQQVTMVVKSQLVDSPGFKSASRACANILPAPRSGGQPEASPARRRDGLAFASCMRSHRVSNFPDPNSQGQLTQEMLSAAGVDVHDQYVQQAAYACVPAANGAITAADVRRAINGQ